MSRKRKKRTKSVVTETALTEITAHEACQMLADETLNVLDGMVNTEDQGVRDGAIELYLSYFINFLLTDRLMKSGQTETTKKAKYEVTSAAFSSIKSGIEFSISDGFQSALSNFSGMPVAYYCLIRPMPEENNKVLM